MKTRYTLTKTQTLVVEVDGPRPDISSDPLFYEGTIGLPDLMTAIHDAAHRQGITWQDAGVSLKMEDAR